MIIIIGAIKENNTKCQNKQNTSISPTYKNRKNITHIPRHPKPSCSNMENEMLFFYIIKTLPSLTLASMSKQTLTPHVLVGIPK